jgi:glucose/arabinose dehydrogenase
VLAFDPDGRNRKIFATGIRNCVGLAIQPQSGIPWCSTNERDGLGDNLVPDYVTRVREGAFYGWPWFYIGGTKTRGMPGHARTWGQGDRSRCPAAGALGLARADVLPRQQFPRRI